MVLPCGVGNLVKGERYPNMDYVLGSALRFYKALCFVFSYDVACQWFKNFFKRHLEWPTFIQLARDVKIKPAIPKLHEPAHKEQHEEFSLNHIVGVGMTDGECPERIWAGHNGLGNSTKTMGPGTRQDTLDDHFSFWNWQKYCSMGETLMRKYKAALRLRNIQAEGHRGFAASMPPHKVEEWEEQCQAWEADEAFPKTAMNPFVSDAICISEAEVRKELAEEEKERVAKGGAALHSTSASGFLVLGLELEDLQRRISSSLKARAHTSSQEAAIAEQRNGLRVKLKNWEHLRAIYMPGLLQFLEDQQKHADLTLESDSQPEECELWLPSQLPPQCRDAVCVTGLAGTEDKLRTAQCYDALEGLRHVLRLKTRMVQFKNANIRGQRSTTRSRAVIDRVHQRALHYAQKYRAARHSKLQLSGPGGWEKSLRVLEDADVRAYTDPSQIRRGPGRRGTVEDDAALIPGTELRDGVMEPEDAENEPALYPDPDPEVSATEGGISLIPEQRAQRDGTGESRRELSWIWTTGRVASTLDDDDLLRSEWAKSRNRAQRATEEVLMLREEMGRALRFLAWKAEWWRQRAAAIHASEDLREGLRAYGLEQASLQEKMALSFRKIFRGPLGDGTSEKHESDVENKDSEDNDGDGDGDDDDDDDGGGGGGDDGVNGAEDEWEEME
ncbi:hypothetical protein H0H92_015744 [Tricholoma furcatifolium]|nr:hypothetical protein H0H92_015744 [Tricholoma furcatifolium]